MLDDLDDFENDVSFSNVMEYIGESKRMIKEGIQSCFNQKFGLFSAIFLGEEVYKAKHIIHCGVKQNKDKQNKDFVVVCLRSSTPSESPHEINLKISDTVDD